ncbi:MAG: tyrosine-protein phosphatase [Faecalibacterium sp.]
MDIRQLHYFLVLCEEMNYTRAAQRLFLSRQALRQSIAALEAELCGPLFLSAHHKLTLTERGVSLQRHAAPVVEQFQQMQAALKAEIQSAAPVVIGISVALVPDYLPGLETQLDKFRQQYPHIEMRFRLMENDAVADGVEQGGLDAGLVMDLGCAAPVLARTTLRADPACLLVPRGHPFWERESVPLAELRGQRVLLPSLRQDLFGPLWSACASAGFAPSAEVGPSFYQAYYLVQEQLCTCLTRYEPGARRELDRVRDVLLEDLPPLCVSLVQRRDHASAYVDLLRSYLMDVLGGAASLPPRRGRPAKPFYNFPVLSSAAAVQTRTAPAHPAPGTELPFAGGHNFRELGGYPADEGKHVRWGQIYRGIPTAGLSSPQDRARLDGLGLRLILDLRSADEARRAPDYVPDGARLVQISALNSGDGREVDFAPDEIERLMSDPPVGGTGGFLKTMYQSMLFGNKAFKELFRALEAGETPILFHCSAGKDRTGTAAMLILLALGASDETICADFAKTNICRSADIDTLLARYAPQIEEDPARAEFYRGIAGVDPSMAPYVLGLLREKYGSAESYLEAEYGLTPARLMRLRRMYLE